jgi:hypothetical protein
MLVLVRTQALFLAVLLLLANLAGAVEARPSSLARTKSCCAEGCGCCAPDAPCCAGKRAPAPSTERVSPPPPAVAKLAPRASESPPTPRLLARSLPSDEVTTSPEERRLHLRNSVFIE